MKKKTVVIGVSDNPERYAFKATVELNKRGHPVVPVGIREGKVGSISIQTDQSEINGVDTVSLYVGPKNQPYWYRFILSLKPKRLILNPGAENPELEKMAEQNKIRTEKACTLVLLSTGQY